MNEITCLKCFMRHPLEECAYECQNEECPQCGDSQPAGTVNGENPVCPSCGRIMSDRLCPDCSFPVQELVQEVPAIPISIVGAERCGKSHYLSVLVDQIKNAIGTVYDCSLYPLGGDMTIGLYDRQYYQPLFVQGQCIPSTQQDEVAPLVYSLVFSEGAGTGKSCSLTLYDACGANFQRERTMLDYNRSIYNAKGILFLIDPSQLPALRDTYLAYDRPVCDGDINALLSRTIHLIREGSGQRSIGKKIDIPIAVCLSKTDTLEEHLDRSSYLRFPSRHLRESSFDLLDYESSSLEVQSLIESWAGKELVNQISSQFEHYGFFGFSSLGSTPNEQNRIARIAPHRVTDPFLWLLWKNEIIHAERVR